MQHLGPRRSVPPSCCSELTLLTRSLLQKLKATLGITGDGVPCKMLFVKCLMRASSKQVLRMQGTTQVELVRV